MKKLIATRSIKTATQHFQEGDKFEMEDKHADPLIACGAAVLVADATLINEGGMPEVLENQKPAKAKKGAST